jgi:hypothetical protein
MFSLKPYLRALLCMMLVVLSLGSGQILHASPPLQEDNILPEPTICSEVEPELTPISELDIQPGEDETTYTIFYTNSLDQSFEITLTSENADMLDTFINPDVEAEEKANLICYEAIEYDPENVETLGTDIAFGDIFLTILSDALVNQDDSLEALMAERLENEELTLQGYLDGLEISSEDILTAALEEANTQIGDAVEAEELDAELAEEIQTEIEEMYTNSFEIPGVPIVPLEEDPEQTLFVDVVLTDGGGIEQGDYVIFAIVDPTVGLNRCITHSWTRKSANITLTVTVGGIGATIYNNGSYAGYLYDEAGGNSAKIYGIYSNSASACGRRTTNTYSLSS